MLPLLSPDAFCDKITTTKQLFPCFFISSIPPTSTICLVSIYSVQYVCVESSTSLFVRRRERKEKQNVTGSSLYTTPCATQHSPKVISRFSIRTHFHNRRLSPTPTKEKGNKKRHNETYPTAEKRKSHEEEC